MDPYAEHLDNSTRKSEGQNWAVVGQDVHLRFCLIYVSTLFPHHKKAEVREEETKKKRKEEESSNISH